MFDNLKKISSKKIFVLKFYFSTIIWVCSTILWEKRRIRIRTSEWPTDPEGSKAYGSYGSGMPEHCLVTDLRGFAEFDPDLLAAAVEGAAGYPVLGRRLLHRHTALDRLQGRVQVILHTKHGSVPVCGNRRFSDSEKLLWADGGQKGIRDTESSQYRKTP